MNLGSTAEELTYRARRQKEVSEKNVVKSDSVKESEVSSNF